VTETRVPLNATMAPQGNMTNGYHITNIFYKYRRCTNFVRVSQTITFIYCGAGYVFVSNPVLLLHF